MSKEPSFNIMLDIETMSQKKTAAVVSIGAVKFTDNAILDTFYCNIDPVSCKAAGLHFQMETIDWWKKQKPEAYRALKDNRKSLTEALTEFKIWYGDRSVPTWANSNSFDCVIMENAFESVDIPCPWKFWDERCFRTFKALFKSDLKLEGTVHNALDDAIYQTKYMLDVLNRK